MLELHPVRRAFELCAKPEHSIKLPQYPSGAVDLHLETERDISLYAVHADALYKMRLAIPNVSENGKLRIDHGLFGQTVSAKYDPEYFENFLVGLSLHRGGSFCFNGTVGEFKGFDPEAAWMKAASANWNLLKTVYAFNNIFINNGKRDRVSALTDHIEIYKFLESKEQKKSAVTDIMGMIFRSGLEENEQRILMEWASNELEALGKKA